MKVISSKSAGKRLVYDIGVPNTHNFVLENGLVSHNCFNKSHAISYSLITYICAWLKANYPLEFFTALMSTRSRSLQPKDWKLKAPEYIHEAKQLGVNIHPPTVNSSEMKFTISNGEIFFGLSGIKDLGLVATRSIVRARGDTPFKNIDDFIQRVDIQKVNTKGFQALVKAGAFDRMGYVRSELLDKTAQIYEYPRAIQAHHERTAANIQREAENIEIAKQIEQRNTLRRIKRLKSERDLTEEEEKFLEETNGLRLHRLLKVEELPDPIELQRKKTIQLSVADLMEQAEYIGCYIGTHPATIVFGDVDRISNADIGAKQELCGSVSNFKVIKDKNGNRMAFMEFGDGTGIAEAVIFSSTYAKLEAKKELPGVGDLIKAFGIVDHIDPQTKMRLFGLEIYRSTQ